MGTKGDKKKSTTRANEFPATLFFIFSWVLFFRSVGSTHTNQVNQARAGNTFYQARAGNTGMSLKGYRTKMSGGISSLPLQAFLLFFFFFSSFFFVGL